MNFEDINSLDDIHQLVLHSSNPDGESLTFEMKGSTSSNSFGSSDKKLLSKEISAFANTYGGVICFHNGADTELKTFSTQHANQIHKPLEGWLKNSLTPIIAGIELKNVDDVFLMKIPESKNKPHMATDRKYYFRHSTSSNPMPEIMVSSFYRSQDHLDFDIGAGLQKMNSQLAVSVWINNNSRLAGTKPRIKISLAKADGQHFKYNENQPMQYRGFDELLNNPKIVAPIAITVPSFAEQILYPEDSFDVGVITTPIKNLSENNIFLLQAECCFLETTSKSINHVFEFDYQEEIKSTKFENPKLAQDYFFSKIVAN